MQDLTAFQPAWSHTFPHRVAPQPGESLVSLLLRCDKENRWESGMTRTFLARALLPRGSVRVNLANLFVPSQQLMDLLAYYLDLPTETVLTTTYLDEQMRFFGAATPSLGYLCFWSLFQVCPVCIREQRVLLRSHFLLGVRSCLQHEVSLVPYCACGALLKPFHATAVPFTCPKCQMDWGAISATPVAPTDLEKERQILACYEWWLRHGNAASMREVLLRLRDLETMQKHSQKGSRWPSYSLREARRRFLAGASYVGSLSALVGHLDELGLLSRFSEEMSEKDAFQKLLSAKLLFS